MKRFINYSLVVLLLFAVGCFMYACSPDGESENISPRSLTNNVVDPCLECQYEDLYKTVGNDNEVVGTVAICQTTTNITLTFTVSGGRTKAWFQISGYGIYGVEPNAITPSPQYLDEKESHHGDKIKSVTYTIPLSSLGDYGDPGDIIYIAAYAVVPGQDGAGGMIWAGNLVPPTQNPNSRYFSYTIKDCGTPPPPTENCTFTQGYWFAKPSGQQWPVAEIEFGGETYNYLEARSIFFGKNNKTGKSTAKQAFLQGLALKLSIEGGADLSEATGQCALALQALADIEDYFDAINIEATATNINTNTFNKNSSGGISIQRLGEAAGIISDCLNENHCDNTPS